MKTLKTEIADTSIKREYGLMDRHSLDKNSGMLFKFPYKNNLSFWMKNTYIPLQIAFINNDGKIMQIEDMAPLSTRAIRAKESCKYALEVNGGWFDRNGISEGSCLIGCGFGNDKGNNLRFAQVTDQLAVEPDNQGQPDLTITPEQQQLIPEQQRQPHQQPQSQEPNATATDSQMNMSIKKRLQRVNAHNKLRINIDKQADVLVIYQTEEGITLMPRVVRGPFVFVPGLGGDLALVNDVSPSVNGVYSSGEKWTCEPGLKTFIIDNILSMKEVKRNDSTQNQEIIAWMKELPEAENLQEQQYFEWMPQVNRPQ